MKKKILKDLNKYKNDWYIENKFFQNVDITRFYKFINQYELLKKTEMLKGSIIECGVFKGNSLIRFCFYRDFLKMKKKVFGFDAFGSFPEVKKETNTYDSMFPKLHDLNTGIGHSKKKVESSLRKKRIKNFKLIKGDVHQTLEYFLKKNKNLKISFIHLDMDVYSSTFYCLNKLYGHLSKGGVILIDDYKKHSGVTKATDIFLKKIGKKIKFIKNLKNAYYIEK